MGAQRDQVGQLYHGTPAELEPGETVWPSYGWAHATEMPLVAAMYAQGHHGNTSGGHIYEVEPLGEIEQDLVSGIGATSTHRGRRGFRVIREHERSPDELFAEFFALDRPAGRQAEYDQAEHQPEPELEA
jgi:hypothetical protein